MSQSQHATVGRIIKTHGVKGEVSFAPAEGLPASCLEGLVVWITPPPVVASQTRVVSVRPGPKGPLIGLHGYDSVEQASAITGCNLVAATSDLPSEWPEAVEDPTGAQIVDETRGALGTIAEVIHTGANDVWVVRGDTYGEILIPVIDDVVLDVDWEADLIRVRLLPGLIDEEAT